MLKIVFISLLFFLITYNFNIFFFEPHLFVISEHMLNVIEYQHMTAAVKTYYCGYDDYR